MRCVVSCGSTSFHGLYSSLDLCCEGPWFTSIQEDGCDKGAHQSYLGAERNTLGTSGSNETYIIGRLIVRAMLTSFLLVAMNAIVLFDIVTYLDQEPYYEQQMSPLIAFVFINRLSWKKKYVWSAFWTIRSAQTRWKLSTHFSTFKQPRRQIKMAALSLVRVRLTRMLRRNRNFRDGTNSFDTDIGWWINFQKIQIQTRRHCDHKWLQ